MNRMNRPELRMTLPRITAALLVGLAGWAGAGCISENGGWASEQSGIRYAIEVDPAGTARHSYPVSAEIELDTAVTGIPDRAQIRLVEVDEDGRIIDDNVPVQIDEFSAAQAVQPGHRLTFLLEGATPADRARTYHLYLSSEDDTSSAPADAGSVELTGEVDHEGQESFEIQTDNAAYFYHKRGAGFASLVDSDGNDWISYNPGVGEESGSGSGGRYRGIPNAGYPEGYAHPGDTVSQSQLISNGPVRVSILSESNDGKMRARWDIYPRFARLTFLKMRPPYWFLYEGTPGGALDMETDYLVRSDSGEGLRTPASEEWTGDIAGDGTAEWLYVGDSEAERVLYLIHHRDDEGIDSYWPMNEEMTVFGFGRRDLDKFMEQVPAQFTIGLHQAAAYDSLRRSIQSVYRPVEVRIDPPEQRP